MRRRSTYRARPMGQWYARPTFVLWALTTAALYAFLITLAVYGFTQ